MISELTLIATKVKLFASCLAVVTLGVADANVTPNSVEDYTLKAMLTIALVFTVRLLLKQQAEHKAELAKRESDAHAERDKREAAMCLAMQDYTRELKSLTAPVLEQATYFKAAIAQLIEKGMHEKT